MRNLLELKYSEIASLLMVVLLAQLLTYLVWGLACVSHPIYQDYIRPNVVWNVLTLYGVSAIAATVWLSLCMSYRQEQRWQIHLCVGALIIYFGTMLYAGYITGLLTLALGVVLAGTPIIGLFLFPAMIVLWSMLGVGAVLTLLTYASVAGYLPYAPLFREQPISGSPDYGVFYFWSQIYFVAPFLLILAGVGHQFLQRWTALQAHVHHLKQIDHLTGLHHRHAAYQHLQEILNRNTGTPFALALLDLDQFTALNKQHGHAIADRMLQHSANTLRQGLRSEDFVARFGADEFLIVFEGVTCRTALSVAERCRQLIYHQHLFLENGEYLRQSSTIGVICTQSQQEHQVDHLLEELQQALQKAKAYGRNRVYSHDCPFLHEHLTLPTVRRVELRYRA